MFNLNDKTYNDAPKRMHISIAKRILDEILIYCIQKKQCSFNVTFHGGEPLLWGKTNFAEFFDYYKLLFPKFKSHNINILFALQTNGYTIDYDTLNILRQNDVSLGISLDGPEKYHDAYRINHSGKGSYKKIMRNIDDIFEKGYEDIFGGFLAVINPEIVPEQYFDWILSLPIRRIDVLYPISFNYNNLPWDFFKKSEDSYAELPTIGNWLFQLFLLWFKNDDPDIIIRKFVETISVIMGSERHGDQMVNDALGLLVIDSNGAIEYHDYFRGFKDGSIKTPHNILGSSLLSLENDILFRILFNLKNFLPKSCKKCNINNLCGGGFLAGRLKSEASDFYLNKSVLCYDHYYYYSNVKKKVFTQVFSTEHA